MQGSPPERVTMLDPAPVWNCAEEIMQSVSIPATFEQAEDLETMLKSDCFALNTPTIVVISHVLKDFGSPKWWSILKEKLCESPRVMVLVLERFPCSQVLRDKAPDVGLIRYFPECINGNYGALLLPESPWGLSLWPDLAKATLSRSSLSDGPIQHAEQSPEQCPNCRGRMALRQSAQRRPKCLVWSCKCRATRPALILAL